MCNRKALKAEIEALRKRVSELEQLVATLASQANRQTIINIPAPIYPTPIDRGDWWKPRWYCEQTTTAPALFGQYSEGNSAARN